MAFHDPVWKYIVRYKYFFLALIFVELPIIIIFCGIHFGHLNHIHQSVQLLLAVLGPIVPVALFMADSRSHSVKLTALDVYIKLINAETDMRQLGMQPENDQKMRQLRYNVEKIIESVGLCPHEECHKECDTD